ncbi:hypothetical protein ES703_67288 [subsurface metagenome]
MEVHKVETSEGKLVRIGFQRTTPEEDLRNEINKWLKRNYPKMTLRGFFSRLDSLNPNLWVIVMGKEDKWEM